LQELPLACGEKNDLAVGQPAGIEVVVAAAGDLPPPAAVDVHLEKVVEAVLRHVALVGLVGLVGQLRIVLAIGEDDLPAVEGEIGPQETSQGHVGRQAAEPRRGRLESFQHEHAAARPRPPAVELVGHVREPPRGLLDEHNRLEVQ
jgi:hypothetical protein